MAKKISVTQGTQAAGTTYTVTNGAHITGDLLLNYLVLDADQAAATNPSIGFHSISTAAGSLTLDHTNDLITYTGSDYFTNGDQVTLTGTTIPTGLTNEVRYFVRDLDTTANTFKLEDSVGAGVKNFTSNGTAVTLTQVTAGTNSPYNGWQMIGTQAVNLGNRTVWAFKVAASAAEGNVTYTAGSNDWIGTSVVVRYANASPFGSLVDGTDFARVAWGDGATGGSASVTTAVDGCLLLYSWGIDGNGHFGRCALNDLTGLDKYSGLNINYVIGYRQQQAAGAAPAVTMYNEVSTEGGSNWVLAIRNDTSGPLQPDIRPDINELKWYGTWNEEHDGSTSWSAPSALTTAPLGTINSIVVTTTAPTVSNTSTLSTDPRVWNTSMTTLGCTENVTLIESPGGSGAWVGGVHSISATDMTGKVLGLMWVRGQGSTTAVQGAEGILALLSDGTNWVAYQLRSRTFAWVGSQPYFAFVAPGNATAYASGGTIASAVSGCTKIGFVQHRITGSTSDSNLGLRDLALFGTTALTGGGAASPAQFQDYFEAMTSWGDWEYAELNSSAQVKAKSSVQLGDGTNATYFDGAAQSFEFPQAWAASRVFNWQMAWNAAANSVGLSVKAKAGDTINLASGVAATDTAQNLSINASSAAAADATYSFAQSFVGWRDPIDNKGLTWNGATFKECGTVTIAGGGDMTNCTIAKTTSTNAALAITANGSVITSTTITVADTSITTAHHISFGASVTSCTLNGVTLSGAAGTDKIYSALASGTLTITVDGTGTALVAGDVTFVGGSTAVAVIAAPQLYQSVTVSGFTAGSRIQIYDTTSSTELFNGTASDLPETVVSGSTVTWTDQVAASADRAIRVRVSYVSGATAKTFIETSGLTCGQTSGTESVTYPVTPTADTTYDSNAVTGSGVTGVTFVDSGSNDRVDCNIAADTIALKDIYAAFVYWNFTATGIANDFTYIDAPDPANYILAGMKIRNTSADPLKITGGYFYDSTGSVENCVDTAGSTGNIFPMPAHVVPYQTTGTYAITGDLQDALDAIAAVPADVIAVAVDGTTTLAESLRLANSVLGGKVSGAGSGTESFRDLADTKNRVVATVDSSGNRTAITRTLT